MSDLGSVCIMLALVLSGYAIVASVVGALTGRSRLVRSGEAAALSVVGLITGAMVCLWILLGQSDFTNQYVWGHSNRDLPSFYKLASLWGGQEGSLLLWNFILMLYVTAVVLLNRNRNRALMPWVVAVMMSSAFFFCVLHNFVANPFQVLASVNPDGSVAALFVPEDGRGLNPLLQHPAMVIHPPVLYTGYIGFIVPFAFAFAALMTRQLGDEWIRTTRRWTLFTWFFLSCGILLGARWAYVELGWGGYWAWDPVENASLMPWLLGTAFLHSVMMQEKKGMLKVWNVVLVLATYTMCLFGTFLTRSGVVSSVHAFAESDIGVYFVSYIALLAVAGFVLITSRLPYLKSENKLEAVISRESGFLFNNLLFVLLFIAVLWGTVFPVLSEAFTGSKIVVGAPYFNRINVPIAILLMLLTGVGPLVAWRRSSWQSLRRAFRWPALIGLVVLPLFILSGSRTLGISSVGAIVSELGYAAIAFALGAFVISGIAIEFIKGGRVRARSLGTGFVGGVVDLMQRNRRRYGGYVVHFGMMLLFLGIAGRVLEVQAKEPLQPGQSFTLRGYTFTCTGLLENDKKDPNYILDRMTVRVDRGGRSFGTLTPERRYYLASEQPTTEVSRLSSWREDLYAVFTKVTPEAPAEIQIFINPLVRYVWLGGIVLGLGTLYAIMPDRRRGAPRAAAADESVAAASAGDHAHA